MCIRDREKAVALSKAQATLDEKQAELQTAKDKLATSSATLQRLTNAYNAAKPVSYTHLDVYKRQSYINLHGNETLYNMLV